jgi:hypothetical protein
MSNQIIKNKTIQLVFPKQREQDAHLPKDLSQYKNKNFFNLFATDVDEITNWFGKFKVDSLEIVINSIINTEEETKLFVGKRENEPAVKLILKPKDSATINFQKDENHDNRANINESLI